MGPSHLPDPGPSMHFIYNYSKEHEVGKDNSVEKDHIDVVVIPYSSGMSEDIR